MVSKLRKWLRDNSTVVAFMLLAGAGAYAIDTSARSTAANSARVLYQSQLDSCRRGNALRDEVNRRVETVNTQRSVLLDFIQSAEEARRATYTQSHHASDKEAADVYQHLANQVQTQLHYRTVPLVDCFKVIKKP